MLVPSRLSVCIPRFDVIARDWKVRQPIVDGESLLLRFRDVRVDGDSEWLRDVMIREGTDVSVKPGTLDSLMDSSFVKVPKVSRNDESANSTLLHDKHFSSLQFRATAFNGPEAIVISGI